MSFWKGCAIHEIRFVSQDLGGEEKNDCPETAEGAEGPGERKTRESSYEVKDGDIVEVFLPTKKITLRVVGNGGYEVLSEERVSKPF